MYKRDRIKTAVLYIGGAAAVGSCLALILFFAYTLRLRTEYREVCLQINDAILASDEASNWVRRGEDIAPLSGRALDYYDKFLLDANTVVFNRRVRDITDGSIQLVIGENTLALTGCGDGTEIHIRWETPGALTCYSVRNTTTSFLHLSAYLDNYIRSLETP